MDNRRIGQWMSSSRCISRATYNVKLYNLCKLIEDLDFFVKVFSRRDTTERLYFRCDIFTESELREFIKSVEETAKIHLVVAIGNKAKMLRFRAVYRCHRCAQNSVARHPRKKIGCNFRLDIRIKHISKDTKHRDPLVKEYPCLMMVDGGHTHDIHSIEDLNLLPTSLLTKVEDVESDESIRDESPDPPQANAEDVYQPSGKTVARRLATRKSTRRANKIESESSNVHQELPTLQDRDCQGIRENVDRSSASVFSVKTKVLHNLGELIDLYSCEPGILPALQSIDKGMHRAKNAYSFISALYSFGKDMCGAPDITDENGFQSNLPHRQLSHTALGTSDVYQY